VPGLRTRRSARRGKTNENQGKNPVAGIRENTKRGTSMKRISSFYISEAGQYVNLLISNFDDAGAFERLDLYSTTGNKYLDDAKDLIIPPELMAEIESVKSKLLECIPVCPECGSDLDNKERCILQCNKRGDIS
jgi:hypothetical protein